MEYAIVVFTDFNEVALVSKTWFDGTSCCLWPDYRQTMRINNAVRKHETPKDSWESYPIRVLGFEVDYLKAVHKSEEALITSDIQTADEGSPVKRKRRRKPNSRYINEDSSEDELPPMTNFKRPAPREKGIIPPSDLPVPPSLNPDIASTTSDEGAPTPQSNAVQDSPGPSTASTPRTGGMHDRFINVRDAKVLLSIEELKSSMKTMIEVQNQILRHIQMGGSVGTDDGLPQDIVLPMQTMDSVDDLERRLQDPVIERCLLRQLVLVGGTNPKDTVRRLLKTLMTDDLAIQFTWKGLQGKRAFESLRIKKIMMCALRQNSDTKNVSDTHLSRAAIDWFRYAKDRSGGRKERLKRKEAAVTQATSYSLTEEE